MKYNKDDFELFHPLDALLPAEADWTEVSFDVTAGTRTFTWTYSKDSSVSRGDDTAWIDDIEFPIASDAESQSLTRSAEQPPYRIDIKYDFDN